MFRNKVKNSLLFVLNFFRHVLTRQNLINLVLPVLPDPFGTISIKWTLTLKCERMNLSKRQKQKPAFSKDLADIFKP